MVGVWCASGARITNLEEWQEEEEEVAQRVSRSSEPNFTAIIRASCQSAAMIEKRCDEKNNIYTCIYTYIEKTIFLRKVLVRIAYAMGRHAFQIFLYFFSISFS